MTWLLRTIVDLFNALAAWVYRRRYGAAARQLGRGALETDGKRGFIILEIDGLAHHYLRYALREGYMPHLARLILARDLRLARWHCGLPSTTPASQAGIMFGNNWDIPGFRWFDKPSGDAIQCKLPGTVRAIQDRIAANRAGLLRGGSSYTNMFDGDARLALFTLSAVGRDSLFENVRGLGFLILFGLSPGRVLKVLALSVWTWLSYVVKRTVNMFFPSKPLFTFWGPLQQIATDIVFREVTTFSVMVDIYRGMPSIYASYTGYDEIAHHFGADSQEALRALRGIDKQLRQIDRIRHLYPHRSYDLYILSDHGMTESVPFRRAFGGTLKDLIAGHTGHSVESSDRGEWAESLPEARIHFLLDEMRAFESRPRRPQSARLLRKARQRLENRLVAEELVGGWDLSRRGDIVVQNSGSLAHVYLNVSQGQMDLSEVTLLFPDLLQSLVDHEGIGIVIGREADAVVIAGKQGTLWLGSDATRTEGQSPLDKLSDPTWAADQAVRLARFPHSGDLVLLGDWDGQRLISFEDQVASHGGLGGPQNWPFIAYSAPDASPARGITSSEQIYTRLKSVYGDYS